MRNNFEKGLHPIVTDEKLALYTEARHHNAEKLRKQQMSLDEALERERDLQALADAIDAHQRGETV